MARFGARRMRQAVIGALVLVMLGHAAPAQAPPESILVRGQPLTVHRYRPAGDHRCPAVIVLSGDGGWELGVVAWAGWLRERGHEVVGLDAARLVRIAGPAGLAGVVDAWPELAHLTTGPTVVLGYSRGATIGLALATLAQPPSDVVLLGVDLTDRFDGPAVPAGLAPGVRTPNGYVVDLRPLFRAARAARVAVIHGKVDAVAPYPALRPWLDSLPEPRLVTILPHSGHGFGASGTVMPAIAAAVDWAAERACRP